ncbi:hypothetical protein MJO28_012531 [Puccinia striiformis f. sp. tritici]|uniref:Uncharacterized protein n=1 Tax=Puccinia striiformis f. sp. tritici TaxID=168172 RepID=A0ACC0E054_9BASI|nr:hypothetical protein MJO28_012531 [Puccinia striiformis f. sp. tritici]
MSTVNTSNTSTNLPLDGQNQSSGRHNRSPLVNDNPNSPSQRRRITETSVLGDLIAIDPYANLLGGLGSNNQLPNLQKRGGVSPLLLLRMTWPNQYTPSWASGLSPLLFKMPEEARTAAILATQCAVLSRLEALTTGVAQLRTAAAQTAEITLLSHADQKFLCIYQDMIRQSARLAFLDADVQSYYHENQPRSLFRLVLRDIQAQTANVHAEVKKHLKQVRHKVRNILLIGILSGDTDPGPIPTIQVLARLLWKHLMGANGGLSDAEIDIRVNGFTKARFAYI